MSDGADERPKDPDGGVHRLLDMLVEEVSLVDRAANKRRFLVVKRESEDMGKKKTEETPGSSGAPAAPSAADAPKPPKKKPAKKFPPGPPTAKAKAPPPKKDPDEEADEEEDDEQDEEDDDKTSKAKPPKKDPEEDPDEEEPDEEEGDEQDDEPDDAPASEDAPTGRRPPKKKATKDEASGAPGPGAPDDEVPDEETPLSVALAALDSLTQAVEILSDSPEDGTPLVKIAGDIRAAADAISTAAGIEPDADENEEPGGESSIQGLVSSIQEMLTKIDSLTQALSASSKTPATTPTITAETQAPPDLAGTLTEVAQSMKSLGDTMKTQAARLDALEKRAGVSNSQPPGERVAKAEPEDPSWPMDMNRPRDRASTQKAVSFHDD